MSRENNPAGFPPPGSEVLFGLDIRGTPCESLWQMSSKPKTPPQPKNPSSPSSTPSKAAPPAEVDEQKEAMAKLLAPALAFHAACVDASMEDVRFMWEVKAIRGEDVFFAKVAGTCTMPGLLSQNQIHMSVERVSAEMTSKVTQPMAAKFQELANKVALDLRASDARPPVKASWSALPGAESDIASEAERISNLE